MNLCHFGYDSTTEDRNSAFSFLKRVKLIDLLKKSILP
jgi:hypothetical protein